MKRGGWWLFGLFALAGPWARGQTASEVSLGYAWQSGSGNRDAFASQYDLSQGLFLDQLRLDLTPLLGGDRFDLQASGFGGEPWRRASLRLDWGHEWSLRLDYHRRASFFALTDFDLGARRDSWAITRWTGSLTYDGWRVARLRLDLRDVGRQGSTSFAFYGLAEPYVGRSALDERVQEAGLSLETRDTPVKVLVEQDIAHYLRRSRVAVGNEGQPAGGTDEFQLAQLTTPGEDSNTVPTTRLAAVFRDSRFEIVAQGLFRRDRLDADRNDVAAWERAGAVGSLVFVDAVAGAADRDTSLGDLRLGFALAPELTLRLRGHYEDATTDGSLLGERILRLTTSAGPQDLVLPVNDRTDFDRTDKDAVAEADWRHGPLGLVVTYHDGSREVDYQRTAEEPHTDVTRDARGWGATASLSPSQSLSLQVGFEDRTFERYVFRTDPEDTQRLWARLRIRPTQGLELSAYGNRERADNPASQSSLDRRNDGAGLAASYTTKTGIFASLSVDWLKLTSDVAIAFFAPTPQGGLSRYETDIVTAGLRASLPLTDKLRVAGGALRVEDRGASLPFHSWSYDLRLDLEGPWNMDYGVFANTWRYSLAHGNSDDYDVTRYGLVLRRRF